MKHFSLFVLTFLSLLPITAWSQPGTITKNPNAVRLREIWGVRGHEENAYVGNGVGGGFDVNNDGLGDFAVRFYDEWRVFYGDSVKLNDTVRWTTKGTGAQPSWFFVGDFYGTGRKALGFVRDRYDSATNQSLFRIYIFRTDDGYLPDTPATIIDTKLQFNIRGWQATDLDGDGADELVLFRGAPVSETWIYRGGAEFQGDTPTVVVSDVEAASPPSTFTGAVGDIDGDSIPDLLTAANYPGGGKMKLYWGDSQSPWSWQNPSRVVNLNLEAIPGQFLETVDCDGDGVLDICIEEHDGNTHIYRSRVQGKNARTRSFQGDDADRVLVSPTFGIYGSMRYLNDTSRRYQMIALLGTVAGSVRELRVFSGGPDGPDSMYDAWHRDDIQGIYGYGLPVDDCDGDGWPEVIFGSATWYSGLNYGKAVILAGGPEIPRDSATSSVYDLRLEEKERAVSLWPNPVRDHLNIAWRGDLRRMPSRFAVHNIQGRLIASGEVEPWRGAAIWRCGSVPAGTYILSMHDTGGALITTASIIKLE